MNFLSSGLVFVVDAAVHVAVCTYSASSAYRS